MTNRPPRPLDLLSRFRLARQAAQVAGHIIMANYGKVQQVETKSSTIDLVTAIDKEADQAIREILSEGAPEDNLITEETFEEGQQIDLTQAWIVDPLDGTTNYAHGFPHFAVSIAYVEAGIVKIGVIFDPFKNELFSATAEGEALRNGLPVRISDIPELGRSLLATGFPYISHTASASENNVDLHTVFLRKTHGIRRAGAAALDLAYTACGRLDGFWEMKLSPWDVAAGLLLIQRAGGQVSDFHGEPIDLSQRRIDIIGSNGLIHEEMLSVTKQRSVDSVTPQTQKLEPVSTAR